MSSNPAQMGGHPGQMGTSSSTSSSNVRPEEIPEPAGAPLGKYQPDIAGLRQLILGKPAHT